MARFGFSLVTTASIICVSLLAVPELNARLITCGLVCEITDRSEERTRSTSVGCMTLPPFTTAAATSAFCSGVTTVSPWPMDAKASLSSVVSVGNFDATLIHGVPVESDPSTVIGLSKPSFLAMDDTLSSPKATPSWANAVFDEYAIASSNVILPSEPSACDTAFVNCVTVPGSV